MSEKYKILAYISNRTNEVQGMMAAARNEMQRQYFRGVLDGLEDVRRAILRLTMTK